MCLSIPARVIALHPQSRSVTVETLGVQRQVSSQLISPPLQLGEFVLLHIGFVMCRIDHHEAMESLECYRQMVEITTHADH